MDSNRFPADFHLDSVGFNIEFHLALNGFPVVFISILRIPRAATVYYYMDFKGCCVFIVL